MLRRRLLHDSSMESARHEKSVVHQQTGLRGALFGNAVFSALFAIMLLLFPGQVVTFAGLPSTFRPALLAWSLMAYGAWLLFSALRREMKLSDVRIAVVLDVAWVVLSIPLALLFPLTNGGRWLLFAVGAAVSLFAFLQWRGTKWES